jgi:hypothetical protein
VDERLDHGINCSTSARLVLEFLQRFSVAKDHEGAEIERLLQAGPIYRQRAANAHVVHAAEAAKRAQSAQKNILIVNVAGSFQPKQHYVGDLAGTRVGSLRVE